MKFDAYLAALSYLDGVSKKTETSDVSTSMNPHLLH
jgi:hypothetical protein